jgi:hypothetical protein
MATSKDRIKEKITHNSLKTFAQWFFAGFSNVAEEFLVSERPLY